MLPMLLLMTTTTTLTNRVAESDEKEHERCHNQRASRDVCILVEIVHASHRSGALHGDNREVIRGLEIVLLGDPTAESRCGRRHHSDSTLNLIIIHLSIFLFWIRVSRKTEV